MDPHQPVPASRDNSRTTSLLRSRETEDLYNGDLSLKKEPFSRTIRIYISFELSDSAIERRHLRSQAYQKLRQFCQSLGLQLVIVELFEVIPSAVQQQNEVCKDDMMYELEAKGLLEMAKKEIKLCQDISLGPTFVTLLAQRYGHKPLHQTIPEDDFKLLVAAIDEYGMRQLVSQWYRLDTNAVPPEYVLQSHGGMSLTEWKAIHQSLSRTTRKAAKVALGKDITKAQYYNMSAVEEEVAHGIFNMPTDPTHSCLWFKRTFVDLIEQRASGDQALASYTDLIEGKRGLEFDSETMKTLNHLKEARMPAKYVGLESKNIFEFSLKWQKNRGIDAENNPSHSEYLSELSEQLVNAVEEMISSAHSKLLSEDDPVAQEILSHASFCKKKSKNVMDRPAVTSAILDYLQSKSDSPLVVYGVTGSGKTSMMARVAVSLRGVGPLKKAALVLRFIGATPHSRSVRHLLLDICKQLCVVYRHDLTGLPGDYRSLCEHMRGLLACATADKPLIILIDGVDELSPEDGALGLSWLPLSLPAHVKLVLSTSSEIKYGCFPVLQSLLSHHQESFVEIPTLNSSECKLLLRHSLKARKRTLTSSQEKLVTEAILQNPNPLYLQFVLREVCSWHSYLWNSNWTPPADLDGATELFFRDVEGSLGRVFTRFALSYITASRDGLSEMELLDILSTEEEVVQEVNQKWQLLDKQPLSEDSPSPVKLTAIPPLLMSRFYNSLNPLLDYHMGTGAVHVLRWSHRHLQEMASRLYLSSPPIAQARYSKLANYFSGKLHQKSATDGDEEDTYFEQPVVLDEDHGLYNVRKLSLLPHFLTRAGRGYELQLLLMDYEWLRASVSSISCLDLVAEFAAVLPLVPIARRSGSEVSMFELALLKDTLSLSVEALNSDPLGLSGQLLGRFMSYVRDPSPMQGPNLKRIVLRALDDHCPKITPLHPLFHLPGGPLLVTMEGHRGLVTSLASTVVRHSADDSLAMIIITSSCDKTLKTWDIKSTGVIKTFDGHTDKVVGVALTENGRYALSGSADKTVRHWLVSTAECLCVLRGHTGRVSAVALTGDGHKGISVSLDKTLKVWNTDTESRTYGQIIFTIKEQREPLLTLSLFQDLLAATLTDNGSLFLTNIESGEVRRVGDDGTGGQVTVLTTARVDWFSYLVTGTEQGKVVVRDFDSGGVCQVLEPSSDQGAVLSLAAGHKVIASYQNKSLLVWDLLTGHQCTLTGHTGVLHTCAMADNGDLLITGGDDHTVQIWDLKRSNTRKTQQQHRGSVSSVVVSPCGNFGLSAGTDSTVIIYDLSSMNIVKEVRGHSDSITALCTLRDARHFLTASSDGSIKLWEGKSGEVVKVFEWAEEKVTCLAVTLDSELLLSGGDEGTIVFWSLKSGENLKSFTNHTSAVVFVGFAKGVDFHYFLSAAHSGEVCVRNFQTAKVAHQSQLVSSELTSATLSPNATLLALGCIDGSCCIVSILTGTRMSTLVGHREAVTSVSVLPANEQCLTASLDKTIRLFDVASGECVAVFCTDLPVTCLSTDQVGEVILYGTREGWVSSVFNQVSEASPVVKELRGIASFSLSSIQTSTESGVSFSSGAELQTPSSDTNPLIDQQKPPSDTNLLTEQVTEVEPNANEPLADHYGDDGTSMDHHRDNGIFIDHHGNELTTAQQNGTDYPIDVNVEVVIGNKTQSLSSSENTNEQVLTQQTETHQLADSSETHAIANGGPPVTEHTDVPASSATRPMTEVVTGQGTTRSSACSVL